MKLYIAIPIAIGLALILTAVISAGPITQKAYAAVSSSSSNGSSGVTTGAGSNGGGVDRHLFCDTGVITPVCK
jgi:hypothetical protein